jgi:hypothetical protein
VRRSWSVILRMLACRGGGGEWWVVGRGKNAGGGARGLGALYACSQRGLRGAWD